MEWIGQSGLRAAKGDWRGAADAYVRAVNECTRDWGLRFYAFTGFTNVLEKMNTALTEEDMVLLKRVAHDETEEVHFRVHALFTRGYLRKLQRIDRMGAAATYRKAIALASVATLAQRAKAELDGTLAITTAGAALDHIVESATVNLQSMTREAKPFQVPSFDDRELAAEVLRQQGDQNTKAARVAGVIATPRLWHDGLGERAAVQKKFIRITNVGGDACDTCGKAGRVAAATAAAEGVAKLSKCQRCQAACYCSKQCQRQAWNAGHKQVSVWVDGAVHRSGRAVFDHLRGTGGSTGSSRAGVRRVE